MFLAIIGPPNGGKGTFVERLKAFFKSINKSYLLLVITVGDIVRWHQDQQTILAQEAEQFMKDSGESLWPDWALLKALDSEVKKIPQDVQIVVFDGFPRRAKQTKWFIERVLWNESKGVVIHITTPDEVCVKRALGRGRKDDGSINQRLSDYHQLSEKPVLDVLSEATCTVEVVEFDGTSPDEETTLKFLRETLELS